MTFLYRGFSIAATRRRELPLVRRDSRADRFGFLSQGLSYMHGFLLMLTVDFLVLMLGTL
jgi:hypothetical protein